jgi:predicted DNA binding CopG/RHH family protein
MQNTADKPTAGYDGHVHFRAPSDLMPAVHAHARRRGLTSASWLRMVILEALDGATPDRREAA